MDCRRVQALAHEYGDGALAPAERSAIEAHVAGCAGCRKALDRVRLLQELVVRGFHVPERPQAEWDRLRSRILAGARPRRPLLWAAAAILVVALGVALSVRPAPSPRPPEPAALAPRSDIPPPAPARSPVRLVEPSPAPAAPLLPPTPRIPDDPARGTAPTEALERMAQESVEAGLATSSSERVHAFFRAAEARLREMDAALKENDPALAQELAQAYTLILREGVGAVMAEREDSAAERAAARDIVRLHAGRNEGLLATLERSAPSGVRGSIREALEASRDVGRTP